MNFLDEFKSHDIKHRSEFDQYYQETLSFLQRPNKQRRHILLEAVEVFWLAGHEDLNSANQQLYEEVIALREDRESPKITQELRITG